MKALLAWLQTTAVATAVGDSPLLTGSLSAVHLLGFTLVTGGAFVANLRLLGALLPDRTMLEVSRPATRGIGLGVLISIATGLLLFAPRAVAASANRTFQIKMLLLASAAAFHFFVHRAVVRRPLTPRIALRAIGAAGLVLWTGVAAAGAAYILLE